MGKIRGAKNNMRKTDADPIIIFISLLTLLATIQLLPQMQSVFEKVLVAVLGYGLALLGASFGFYLRKLDHEIDMKKVFGES